MPKQKIHGRRLIYIGEVQFISQHTSTKKYTARPEKRHDKKEKKTELQKRYFKGKNCAKMQSVQSWHFFHLPCCFF